MVPMNEMHRYLHNGLQYLVNTATDHYDFLIPFRYYNKEIVCLIELILQAYYLTRKFPATYGENFYGFIRTGIQ